MALLHQLFPASFDGIPFFVSSSDTAFGRKTATHEYPNKKFRYTEDLGENLRVFNITAIVTGNYYLLKRNALLIALNRKGIGILTHPFYGIANVVCKEISNAEDLSALGECRISIIFEETNPNVWPSLSGSNISNILGIITKFNSSLTSDFTSKFGTIYGHNITDSGNKITKLNGRLDSVIHPYNTENDSLNIFRSNNKDLSNNKFHLIQNPNALGNSIIDLLDSFNDLAKTKNEGYALNSKIYQYGDDDISIDLITEKIKEKLQNRLSLNSLINSKILTNLYYNAILINYLDDEQLLKISNDLESKYQYLMNNNNLSEDALSDLENLRNKTRLFFDKIRVNISKVIEVEINAIPLSVLLYRYYENFDNEDEIISLNVLHDGSVIEDDIKILTA